MVMEKRDKDALQGFSDLFLVLGVLMTVFGGMLIIFPLIGTFAIDLILGVAFFVIGITGIVVGVVSKKWKGAKFIILNGVIALIFSLLLLFYPLGGVITLTLLMGILLILEGIFEIGKSLQLRHKFWRKAFLIDGVCALLLGVLVLMGWPDDSLWAMGFIAGLSFLFIGVPLIWFSSAVKKK